MDEIRTPKAPRFDAGCRACRLAEDMGIGKAGDLCDWHAGYFSSVAAAEIERYAAAREAKAREEERERCAERAVKALYDGPAGKDIFKAVRAAIKESPDA